MRNRKFLFMINDMNVGGAEVGLVDVLNELVQDNSVDLILLRKQGPLLNRLDQRINVHSIIKSEKNVLYNKLIRYFYFMGFPFTTMAYRATTRKKYDVEVAYLEGYPAVFIANSPNRKSVKIASIRNGLKKHPMKIMRFAYGRHMMRRAYRRADHIYCVSEMAKTEFLELYPECSEKTVSLYTYFDVESIRQKAEGSGELFPRDKINFLAVGRFSEQKGYLRLVDAFEQIAKQYPDVLLHILGETNTDYGKTVLKAIHDKELDSRIVIHGVIQNPYPYIKNCDVFLSSSLYEGFPRVINEALALGKFCIGTDVTGTHEALQGGRMGLLAVDSTEGMVRCMESYLKDPNIASRYADALQTFDGNKKHFFEGFAELCRERC